MGTYPCKWVKRNLSSISKVTASLSLEDACYQVDVMENVVFKEMKTLSSSSKPLETCLLGTYDMAQAFPPQRHPREIVNEEVGQSKEDKKCTLKVEQKLSPSYSRYEFLGLNDTFPIIVNASLDET